MLNFVCLAKLVTTVTYTSDEIESNIRETTTEYKGFYRVTKETRQLENTKQPLIHYQQS